MEADDFRRRLVPGADLRRVTFPAFDELHGSDLRGADLRGADLRAVSWLGADGAVSLAFSNLSDVDFRGAELGTPDFDAANLRGATLSGLDLRRTGQFCATSFDRADLTGADLSGVNVDGGFFDAALLAGANLNGAVLTSCTLRNACLAGASLIGANLQRATLRGADLRGADLTSAALPSDLSAFAGARFDASTRWSDEMRAKALANSVAEPDGTHVINSPPPPAPPAKQPGRTESVVGRVIAFPLGAGVTVLAVLMVTGDFVAVNGAGEPITSIFVRLLLGLIYGAAGLVLVAGAILGFPEGPPGHSGTSRDRGFDGDVDGCGIDAD